MTLSVIDVFLSPTVPSVDFLTAENRYKAPELGSRVLSR